MTRPASLMSAAAFTLLTLAPILRAGPSVPDYDFTWCTIGDPGNAPYSQDRGPQLPPLLYGGVDYTYRISKYETTASQWLEFANAFAKFNDPYLAGQEADTTIQVVYGPGGSTARFTLLPGVPNAGQLWLSQVNWFNAARYCNWLTNGKQDTLAALDYGAYDLRNIHTRAEEIASPPVPRLPGATFFIPDQDEWVKAVHFDPNRYGPNQPGYWQYCYSSDTAPIPGPPGVGQTNTGYNADDLSAYYVGAYPNAQTPWGLLDASGGAAEWLEDRWSTTGTDAQWEGSAGLGQSVFAPASVDRIDVHGAEGTWFPASWVGLRIASVVPSPCWWPIVAVGLSWRPLRRTA